MLPITSIVLFKHGVGYFEREGIVSGEARTEMSFRASEMNDVLKSLTVLAHEGGEVTSISYESTQPLSRQLEDFAIKIPEGRAMSGLLAQLTGTPAVVHRADGTSEGTIAGVEPYKRKVGDDLVEGHRISLWVDGMSLESHDLADVRRVELSDPTLRKDLQHLLDILISAKKKDLKRLAIFSNGADDRTLAVSYVIETPVWKTSYRVLLYGDVDGSEGSGAQIQGWAIIDNTQDEDWTDVRLTLVAGLPISFVHDLYSPRYKRRPEVVVAEEEAYAPPELESGIAAAAGPAAFGGAPPAPRAAAAPGAPARAMARKRRESPPPAPKSAVTTRTQEVGDLLHYEIANPVTVARKQSALVPILHRPFEGKRVAIYNRRIREANPMSALLFKNTTGLTLEGGPMTVLEEGHYVGEAMLDTLKPDEERVVPFSVELSCRVQEDHRSKVHDVHRVRIVSGWIEFVRYRIAEKVYVIQNKGDKAIDLFLDHPFTTGYELHQTPEPVERTDSYLRFRLEIAPKSTLEFVVREKGEESQNESVVDLDTDTIVTWSDAGTFDEELRARLDAVVAIRSQLEEVDRVLAALRDEIEKIHADQGRLRENLQALGTAADERKLRERYVSELGGQEDRLGLVKTRIRDLQGSRTSLEKSLQQEVANLDYDRTIG